MPVSWGSKCVPGAEFGGICLRRQYAELRSNLADAQQAGIASKLHVCNAALRVNISVQCTPWAPQGDSYCAASAAAGPPPQTPFSTDLCVRLQQRMRVIYGM